MFMSASFGFLGVCLNVSRRARAFLYIRFWAPLGVSQSASRRLWTSSCDSPRYFAFPKASLSSFRVPFLALCSISFQFFSFFPFLQLLSIS